MDDEIDLREFLRPLIAKWKLILTLGLLAAVVTAVIKQMTPPTYQAEALVSVAAAHYSLRLQGQPVAAQVVPVKAYSDFAVSSEVLDDLFGQFRDKLPPGVNTLSKFQRLLSVAPASDPTVLRLTVQDPAPTQAAEIANTWAKVFATKAGTLFGQDQTNVLNYEQKLAQAKDAAAAADDALARFQASNQVNILKAELASKQAVLTDSLNRQYQIGLLVGDTQDLLDRLGKLTPTAPANVAEDLALLSIMTRVYGSPSLDAGRTGATASGLPSQPMLQVQLGTDKPLVGATVADQRALAEDLLSTLQARGNGLDGQVQAIRPDILDLQGQLAQAQVNELQLTQTRDSAADQYKSLESKVDEAKIALAESTNIVEVASRAAVPTEPIASRLLASAVVAGAVGLLVGVVAVLFLDQWRKRLLQPNRPETSRATAGD